MRDFRNLKSINKKKLHKTNKTIKIISNNFRGTHFLLGSLSWKKPPKITEEGPVGPLSPIWGINLGFIPALLVLEPFNVESRG